MRAQLVAAVLMMAPLPLMAQVVDGAADRIRADMSVLASDSFSGRKPGSPAEKLTTDYLIRRFREVGLEPLPTGWLQPVPLETRMMKARGMRVAGRDVTEQVAMVGRYQHAEVFDGIVLYRDSDAPGASQPRPTDGLTRLAVLAATRAKAALAIVPDAAFVQRKASFEAGITSLPSDTLPEVRGIISESAARALLGMARMNLDSLEGSFRLPLPATLWVITLVNTFTSHNVAGVLRGSVQPFEYVLYTAHWDSFGRCQSGVADQVCNGAIDNASGTAGLVELARAFATGPRPDRSILFLATTAEELGLAGTRHYVRQPLVPLGSTIASFNLDVITLYGRGNTVGFVGAGLADADSVFARYSAVQGRSLDTGPLTRMVLRSSDAWSLLKAGVPSFILSGAIGTGADGSRAFHEYLGTRYHRPGDEMLESLPMGGAVEEVELLYAVGSHYARAGTTIHFAPGSPFQRQAPFQARGP